MSAVDIAAWSLAAGERFTSKCVIRKHDQCWEWIASSYQRGYGKFRMGQRWMGAHRRSLEATGVSIDGWHVLHSCDNPPCVNPDHLRRGDRFDNMRDMARKKRFRSQTGELSYRAILTESDVISVRGKFAALRRHPSGRIVDGELMKLTSEFGVSSGCIRHAAQGRNWSHIK